MGRSIRSIAAMPTSVAAGEPTAVHESCLRSWSIVEKTKELLAREVRADVLLELIGEMESGPGGTFTASTNAIGRDGQADPATRLYRLVPLDTHRCEIPGYQDTVTSQEVDSVLVLRLTEYLSNEQASMVRASAERIWPGRSIAIVDGAAQFVRLEAAE